MFGQLPIFYLSLHVALGEMQYGPRVTAHVHSWIGGASAGRSPRHQAMTDLTVSETAE